MITLAGTEASLLLQRTEMHWVGGGVPDPGEAGEEVPVRAGHEHPGGESVQLDGVAVD